MIPYTFPSTINSTTGRRQCVVFYLTDITGLVRWTNYIPVESAYGTTIVEGTTDNNGYQAIEVLSSTTGKVAWIDYIPVYDDTLATTPWQVSSSGYIPVQISGTTGSPILDRLSVSPAAAYGPRKLRSAYTGSAIRVRRSSDNADLDIGFVGENLDETALMAHVGHQNLLTYSEQADDVIWTKANITVTANSATAPDGTLTADTITGNGALVGHALQQSLTVTSGVSYTQSVYAKASTNNFMQMIATSTLFSANAFANFDLSNGTVGTVGSASTASIESVGNGWYRCRMTAPAIASSTGVAASFAVVTSATAVRGEGNTLTTSIFVWGAQVNVGAMQPYQQTEATANPGNGFVTTEYDQTGKTYQNLLTYSEDFSNAAWGALGGSAETVTVNAIAAPNGAVTADLVTVLLTGSGRAQLVPGLTAGQQIKWVVRVKRAGVGDWVRIHCYSVATPTNQFRCFVNMATGALGVADALGTAILTSASVEPLGDGWHKVVIVGSIPGVTDYAVVCAQAAANGDPTRVVGQNRYIWGGQVITDLASDGYAPTAATNAATVTNYNKTHATALEQPQIVAGGVILRLGTRPASTYAGAQILARATPIGLLQSVAGGTLNTVSIATSVAVQGSPATVANALGTTRLGQFVQATTGLPNTSARTLDADAVADATGASSVVNQSIVRTSIATYSAGTVAQFINGVADASAALASSGNTSNTAPTFISSGDTGLVPGANPFVGAIPEQIIFNSALSTADRQLLERNQGQYYSITVA